jgi:hypothetical protein
MHWGVTPSSPVGQDTPLADQTYGYRFRKLLQESA